MGLRRLNLSYTSENRYIINKSTVFIKVKSLTKRWVTGFSAAKDAIVYSEGKCPGHFLGSAIFHGNRLLCVGNNTLGKSKPGNTVIKENGTEYNISCHAEQAAVDKIKHREGNTTNLIMYVVRVNSEGAFVNSRPCNMCLDYMKKYGIKTVRFINKLGIPEELKLT